MKQSERVFCIGFQKTGTTSLGLALSKLGYDVCGFNNFRHLAHDANLTRQSLLDHAASLTEQHNAFKDSPWPIFYKEMHSMFPNAKFIHVTRDTTKWIRSAVKDFSNHPNMIRRVIYGNDYPLGNEDGWIKTYTEHNESARRYFQELPEQYIRLSLDDGEVNYASICAFLGHPTPQSPWPVANTRLNKKRRMLTQQILNKITRYIKQ